MDMKAHHSERTQHSTARTARTAHTAHLAVQVAQQLGVQHAVVAALVDHWLVLDAPAWAGGCRVLG